MKPNERTEGDGSGRDSRQRRAVLGLGSGYLSSAVMVVVGLVLTPFILGHIGRPGYGVWAVLGQVVGYVGLTEMGVGSAMMTYASRMGRGERGDRLSQLVTTAVGVQVLFGIASLLIAAVAVPFLPRFIDLGGTDQLVVVAAFLIVVLARSFQVVARPFEQTIVANQALATSYSISLGNQLLRAALIVVLLYAGLDLVGMALAALGGNLFSITLWVIAARKTAPGLEVAPRFFCRSWLRPLIGFSIWSFLGRTAAVVIYNTDNIVVSILIGSPAVATYVLTRRLLEVLRQQIFRIGNVLRPGVGEIIGGEENGAVPRVFLSSFRFYLVCVAVGGVSLAWITERFVGLWVGPENFGGQALVWVTLASLACLSMFHISSVFVVADLGVRTVAITRFTEALINLVVSVTLAKLGYGLVGVAAGTLIASLATSAWRIPLQALRRCGVTVRSLFFSAGMPSLVAATTCLLACWCLSHFRPLTEKSWTSLLCFVAILSLPNAALVGFLGMSRAQRMAFLSLGAREKWLSIFRRR